MRLHRGDLTILKELNKLTMVITFPLRSSDDSPMNENGSSEEKSISSFRQMFLKRVSPVVSSNEIDKQGAVDDKKSDWERSSPFTGQTDNSVYKVLVVDDSALVRKMTVRLMHSLGHSCEEADDGDIAVELVRNQRDFDVILMDNQMPRMKGEDASRIIRSDLKFEGIILGVTGNVLPEEIAAFKRKGADEVVVKPMSATIFFEKIAEIKRRKGEKKKQIIRDHSAKSLFRTSKKVSDSFRQTIL